MSLLIEASPEERGIPQVEDAPSQEVARAGGTAPRGFKNLPKDVLLSAHQATWSFHDQEIREAEWRGMPEEQVALHRLARENTMAALVTLGAVEMVPVQPELSVVEPAIREVRVPELALPELALSV